MGHKPILGSGVLDVHTLQSYVRTTADRAGLRVQFVHGLAGPCTDNKGNIKIPAPTQNVTKEDIARIRHGIVHEVGHQIKGHDGFKVAKDNGIKPGHGGLGILLNAIEDSRIEKAMAKDYLGDKQILIEGRDLIYKHAAWEGLKRIDASDKDSTCVAMSVALMTDADSEWNTSDILNRHLITSNLPKHVHALLEKCKDKHITERIRNTRNAEDSLAIAKELYELIYEKSADEHIKELKEKQKAEAGSGEASPGAGEEAEGTSSSDAGDGTELNKKAKSLLAEYRPPHFSDDVATGANGMKLDYTNFKESLSDSWKPCTIDEISCIDMRTGRDIGAVISPVHRHLSVRIPPWVAEYKNKANAKTLANRIRRFLQVKSQAYYIPNQNKGKLCSKTLYRVGMPQVGDGEWNKRVYKQKREADILDVAVSVLVDYSGSMRGGKIENAIQSAMILTECLGHGLRVPVEILGFTENGMPLTMILVKSFDDRASMDVVGNRMIPGTGVMSQNNDGDAVLFAYNRLKRRKEKRKMLFVLSDGSPCSNRGEAYGYTKRVVKSIEKEKQVEILGIGIQDTNVRNIYAVNEVLSDSNELENKLLSIVQRRIINEEVK